ncbi:cytochrome p450 [Trifolium pratense]|uniref:Cytochrome p450 n=1 Tax=Trifolium pratense TaxID=57577 RepID=A0A2K3NE20_TRIPR|nr:cytochrome p450 [Trifolium pratense]
MSERRITNDSNSITENLFSILERLDKNQQELFSVMMWSIWKCRNNQVWNNISDSAQTVYERANHLITSWRNAQEFRALVDMPRQLPHQTTWIKPSIGRYKCNVDASFSYLHNKVGIGMCIRDDQGRFVKAKTEWFEPILDVEIDEAIGLLSTLKWIEVYCISMIQMWKLTVKG